MVLCQSVRSAELAEGFDEEQSESDAFNTFGKGTDDFGGIGIGDEDPIEPTKNERGGENQQEGDAQGL